MFAGSLELDVPPRPVNNNHRGESKRVLSRPRPPLVINAASRFWTNAYICSSFTSTHAPLNSRISSQNLIANEVSFKLPFCILFSERKYTSSSFNSHNHLDKRTSTEKVLSSLATQAARAAINEADRSTTTLFNSSSSSPALTYSLGKSQTVKGLARKEPRILNHLCVFLLVPSVLFRTKQKCLSFFVFSSLIFQFWWLWCSTCVV